MTPHLQTYNRAQHKPELPLNGLNVVLVQRFGAPGVDGANAHLHSVYMHVSQA